MTTLLFAVVFSSCGAAGIAIAAGIIDITEARYEAGLVALIFGTTAFILAQILLIKTNGLKNYHLDKEA
ncbi:hypothetical protein [Candidatus Magnetobacterium casense]|uniref:Uncharacterized protein n=1 Tax=Candidatus Magnetobacterium casense TaxID=1455061 RepID=A0ABS6S2H6_9BACT|nr:hypothetical protein [Candidatus Magnetobacterium casensis]MBV6343026.1 hypothetical protein [Candidatus Magnetobacterium casensis]